MNESSIQEFESLKKEIEDLKVKQLSNEMEKARLEKELEAQKAKIKEIYGVEIEDFEKAIKDLQEEFEKKKIELLEKLTDCKKKLGLKE